MGGLKEERTSSGIEDLISMCDALQQTTSVGSCKSELTAGVDGEISSENEEGTDKDINNIDANSDSVGRDAEVDKDQEKDCSKSIEEVIQNYCSVLPKQVEVYKKSPFTYYKGMRYTCKRRFLSKNAILEMIHHAEITQTNSMILEALRKYTYLNSYMIRSHLYAVSGGAINLSREKSRTILKNMINRGLIMQYELFHMEDGEEQGSAFIYSLTRGGEIYCNYLGLTNVHKKFEKEQKNPIPKILTTLAINQFHILLEASYKSSTVVKRSDIYKRAYVSANVAGDYAVFLDNHTTLSIYLTAVRDTLSMADEFLSTIRKLVNYLYAINCTTYFLLVICETEHQILECERLRCSNGLSKVSIMYTTDTYIATHQDVFSRLIRVVNVDKGEKQYIKLNIL